MGKPVVAICYDFDKTLSTDDMQTFSFIPNLGLQTNEFWDRCNEFAKNNQMDSILTCMKMMIDACKEKNIKLTREYLFDMGKNIKYYDGVTTWFDRINEFGKQNGVTDK